MHPLFPSGEWEGFYTYQQGPGAAKNKMAFILNFKSGIIRGVGSDEVGSFSWRGNYDTETLKCDITKHYVTHKVYYKGDVDENGIWGMWSIDSLYSGGFHIWPKKNTENRAIATEETVELSVEVSQPDEFDI